MKLTNKKSDEEGLDIKVKAEKGGCLGCIVFIIALWAIIFGVTIGGVHHGISCTQKHGVMIK